MTKGVAHSAAKRQQAVDLVLIEGVNVSEAARRVGTPRPTVQKWVDEARRGLPPPDEQAKVDATILGLRDQVRELEGRLRTVHRDNLTAANVREAIFNLSASPAIPPSWIAPKRGKTRSVPDVPVLLLSDFHWGEVVDPAQVNGINEYDMATAQRRLRAVIEKAIYLYDEHVTDHDAPGIVVFLGGDMISGDIHTELSETNEMPIMPVWADLHGCLMWALRRLADRFGRVFVAGVAGNHGRNTMKPRNKQRAYSNFDWLLYTMLERSFLDDKRVTFHIPEGADAYIAVNGHRFLLTHGDNLGVKGGDGIIGALGPILRGDFKVRNSQSAVGMPYDTLVMGHWHQYLALPRVIVNGALKGYDEFARLALRSFPEAPIQAMFHVSATYGIVRHDPVFAETPRRAAPGQWVAAWEGGK